METLKWKHEYMTLLMQDQENIEKGMLEGKVQEIIETGYDFNMSENDILKRLQTKLNISMEKAKEYLNMYSKQDI